MGLANQQLLLRHPRQGLDYSVCVALAREVGPWGLNTDPWACSAEGC